LSGPGLSAIGLSRSHIGKVYSATSFFPRSKASCITFSLARI
jgi:hypothetical protein